MVPAVHLATKLLMNNNMFLVFYSSVCLFETHTESRHSITRRTPTMACHRSNTDPDPYTWTQTAAHLGYEQHVAGANFQALTRRIWDLLSRCSFSGRRWEHIHVQNMRNLQSHFPDLIPAGISNGEPSPLSPVSEYIPINVSGQC